MAEQEMDSIDSKDSETRQTGEIEVEDAANEIADSRPEISAPSTHQGKETTDAASSRRDLLSEPPVSSPGSDPLALPPAAQPVRPSTPLRRSTSPTVLLPPSSTSSDDTILCSTRPARQVSAKTFVSADETASDDSLRLMPVTSSVVRSKSGGGGRCKKPSKSRDRSTDSQKSVETEGGGDELEITDGSSSDRSKSKSPTSDSDKQIREFSSAPEKKSTSKPTKRKKSRTRQIVDKKESNHGDSDDDLDLLSSSQASVASAPTGTKRKTRRRSTFVCVEVPAPSRASSRSTPRESTIQLPAASQPPPVVVPSETTTTDKEKTGGPSSAEQTEDARKRRKTEHSFELVIENQPSSSNSRRPSPTENPSSRPTSPPQATSSQPQVDPSQAQLDNDSDLATITALLGEGDETLTPSSPLSSVPASTPPQTQIRTSSSPPPTSATVASKRPLPSHESDNESNPAEEVQTSQLETASSEQGSPKKKARVPKVSVKQTVSPTKSSAPAPKVTRKKATTSGKSRAKTAEKEKEKEDEEVPKSDERQEDDEEGAQVGSSNGWGTRPKRKKTARKSMREESSSESDGSGTNEEEETTDADSASEMDYRSSPPTKSASKRKRTAITSKPKASPRGTVVKKGKKKETVESGSKSKGKGKRKAKEQTRGDIASAKAVRSSSPPKSSLRATNNFLLDLSQPAKSKRETREDRAQGWDVAEFDDYVWVHVPEEEEKGAFWWIGKITNKLRSERPLSVELFVDANRTILNHSPSPVVALEEPSPDNILKFRSRISPSLLRFSRDTFRDNAAPKSDATSKFDSAFDDVLLQALKLESSFGEDDDSDDSDSLPDPSQLGASQRSKKPSQKKKQESSTEEEDSEKADETESEDETMKEKDEISSFPFYCLAKDRGGWWAATCVGYAEGTKAVKGRNAHNGPKQKFNIEYPSGHTAILPRSSLLFSRQSQFSTVKLQETTVEFQPQYLENAIAFIKKICPEELQQILEETFLPAQSRNDAFYAGGREREQLAATSVFGELPTKFIEDFSDTIESWLLPKKGTRPKGSPRYEALPDLEKIRYIADVLLPAAIVLNYIDDLVDDDEPLEEQVRKAFLDEGNSDPTQDEVDVAVYKLAYKALSSRSATKAVKSMREGRKTAQNQKKGSQRSRR